MTAVIFPGQGAQYIGMGQSLYDNFVSARDLFGRIDQAAGFPLSQTCFQGPAEALKDTATQQLAILAVSLAACELFKSLNIQVSYLGGLSLGEYSCLYAAGVLGLEDVVGLVKERALAMAEAASLNPATMLAVVGLPREALAEKAGECGFYIANINSSQQIVVSVKKEDKDKVSAALGAAGARVVELAVSGGFHSPFMQPACERLQRVLAGMDFKDAQIPIVSNVTGLAHSSGAEIKDNLAQQLVRPVLWCDCVEFMCQAGVEQFFEVGPSRVLRGLMRKINPRLKVTNVEKKEDWEGLCSSKTR